VQLLPGRSRYRRARPWSAMLGRYDNWSATRCARCAEFGVTEALPLIHRRHRRNRDTRGHSRHWLSLGDRPCE
jgi:hypothetical protein